VPVDFTNSFDMRHRGRNGYGLRIGGRRDPTPRFVSEITVENVTIRNARNGGISIYKSALARVVGCTVIHALGKGIGFDGCTDSIMASENIVHGTGDDMLVVVTDATVPGGTRSAIFSNNIVRNGEAKGIASSGVDRLLICGNIIENTYAAGVGVIEDTFYGLQ